MFLSHRQQRPNSLNAGLTGFKPGANLPQKQQTALMLASKTGFTETIKLLLKHGANIHATDNNGQTALMLASQTSSIETSSIETIKLLLKHGANIHATNNQGETMFQVVINSSKPNRLLVVEWLLDNQAFDVDAQDTRGDTALIRALRTEDMHMARVLSKRASGHIPNKQGETALDLLTSQDKIGVYGALTLLEILHLLEKNGTKLSPKAQELKAIWSDLYPQALEAQRGDDSRWPWR